MREGARAHAEVIRHCLNRRIGDLADPARHLAGARHDAWRIMVNGSISSDWSVEQMAARMHLSCAQFRRVVTSHHGMTPREVLTRPRIGRTKEPLLRTDYSLGRIAEKFGYDSPFSLSRAFKGNTGASPREFRRSTYPE